MATASRGGTLGASRAHGPLGSALTATIAFKLGVMLQCKQRHSLQAKGSSGVWRHWSVWLLVVAGDRITKGWAQGNLVPYQSRPLLAPWLDATLVYNPGGAFGIWSGHGSVLALFTCVLLISVIWAWKRLIRFGEAMKWGLTLATAGALGNLIDRVLWGYVIDFLDVGFWPVFNGADIALCVGLTLVGWSLLRAD
ncbi:MAG: signal peptidase II [Firmicutes bacterium]|nr:signal peptidase II [Bacillota bacterium]